MAIQKTVLKRYDSTAWYDVYLKTTSDIVYRTNGATTVESDLTNFLPSATGSDDAPASNTLGKLLVRNDGTVYSANASGTPIPLKIDDGTGAGVQYVQSSTEPTGQNEGDFWELPLE